MTWAYRTDTPPAELVRREPIMATSDCHCQWHREHLPLKLKAYNSMTVKTYVIY